MSHTSVVSATELLWSSRKKLTEFNSLDEIVCISHRKTQELNSVPLVIETIEQPSMNFPWGWSLVAIEITTSTFVILQTGSLLFRNTNTSPENPRDPPTVNMIGCPGMMSLPVTCGRVRHTYCGHRR